MASPFRVHQGRVNAVNGDGTRPSATRRHTRQVAYAELAAPPGDKMLVRDDRLAMPDIARRGLSIKLGYQRGRQRASL